MKTQHLTASDLMIGDWVTFRDDPNIPIKIWGINEDGTAFAFIDKDRALDEIAIDDEIIGIPLTSEILEKNGFTKENRLYYWTQEKDGKTIAGVYYWVDEKHINIAGYEDDGVTISCHYVHELQHALKLCRIDKTIELGESL